MRKMGSYFTQAEGCRPLTGCGSLSWFGGAAHDFVERDRIDAGRLLNQTVEKLALLFEERRLKRNVNSSRYWEAVASPGA